MRAKDVLGLAEEFRSLRFVGELEVGPLCEMHVVPPPDPSILSKTHLKLTVNRPISLGTLRTEVAKLAESMGFRLQCWPMYSSP